MLFSSSSILIGGNGNANEETSAGGGGDGCCTAGRAIKQLRHKSTDDPKFLQLTDQELCNWAGNGKHVEA